MSDLEFARNNSSSTVSRLRRAMLRRHSGEGLTRLLEKPSWPEESAALRAYESADVVLSSPGGFLHDHYPTAERLDGFEFALNLGKPLVLVGQSIGPFWQVESRRRVRDVFSRAAAICVRDDVSRRHLMDVGVPEGLVHRTGDAAFLLSPPPAIASRRVSERGTVALSLRAWPPGTPGDDVVSKARNLLTHLLTHYDDNVLFLSTCQGVPRYIDDSRLAERVVSGLRQDLQNRCSIENSRLPVDELIARYAQCDIYVGMRLHGAILAMLGGVPAAGLAYESKTPEIFGELGMGHLQVPFEADSDDWVKCADRLIREADEIRAGLPARLASARARAERNLDVIAETLTGRSPRGLA